MTRLWNLLQLSFQPPATGEGSVAYWQACIVARMLQAGAVLGLFACIPSILLSAHKGMWSVVLVDVLSYAWVLAAALAPGWSHATRVRGVLTVMYLIALVLMVHAPSACAGLLWICILPVLAALFLDLRAGFIAWLVALGTILACAWAMATGHIGLPGPALFRDPEPLLGWLVTASSALFLGALVALSCGVLLRGLEQTHQALAREEERFARVFQLSPEPIAISRRADGRILDVNGAWTQTFGWSRAESLGRPLRAMGLLPSDGDGDDRARMEAELAATGALLPRTLELNRRDGTRMPALVSARLLDLAGEACLLIVAQDLTTAQEAERERRRLEAELLHAQKLESIGSLAGGVAHDMNNILVGILGLTSMLQQQYTLDPALAKALASIRRAGDRGRKLVRSLTDFARKGLDDAQPVDLNELVAAELDLLRSTTLQKIDLVEDLAPDLPRVLGEPAALTNAIMNLCVNAVDAMPAGGVLCLQTRANPAGEVEVIVTDTGQGMAPEVLARAMEPFFTTKPPGKGTGLGLPGVYGTLKAHGGSVQLTSEVARGTRVVLRFPRYAPEEATPPHLAAPAPAGSAQALFILVVDDDPVIQETLPSLLGFLGHRCRLAVGGQEALDLLAGGLAVDLVILDHNMPGLSGADTLVRLREALPQLPVLLSTGFLEPGVEELTHRFPGVALLYKPYSLAGIRRKLEGMQLGGGTRPGGAQLIS